MDKGNKMTSLQVYSYLPQSRDSKKTLLMYKNLFNQLVGDMYVKIEGEVGENAYKSSDTMRKSSRGSSTFTWKMS